MATEPGGDVKHVKHIDIKPTTATPSREARPRHDHQDRTVTQNMLEARTTTTASQPRTAAPATTRPIAIPVSRIPSGDATAPRLRVAELHRRRSQTLCSSSGGSAAAAARGAGVNKGPVRAAELSAALRKHGSSADLHRKATSATRERMYNRLAAAASTENLAASPSPTSPTKFAPVAYSPAKCPAKCSSQGPKSPPTTSHPIPVSRPPVRDQDMEMLEVGMLPPPASVPSRSNSTGHHTTLALSSLPIEARNDRGQPGTSTASGSLKRSASSGSQTVMIYECPALEVDEHFGAEEDLSWLNNDHELEQMIAMASSHRPPGRTGLAFKRSQEAAMQCSQVVRNVPRMRKRRDRKLDRRRHSLTLSESTICLSSTPSPTATPAA